MQMFNPKGSNIETTLDITLEELFKGGQFTVHFHRKIIDYNNTQKMKIREQIGPLLINQDIDIPQEKLIKDLMGI